MASHGLPLPPNLADCFTEEGWALMSEAERREMIEIVNQPAVITDEARRIHRERGRIAQAEGVVPEGGFIPLDDAARLPSLQSRTSWTPLPAASLAAVHIPGPSSSDVLCSDPSIDNISADRVGRTSAVPPVHTMLQPHGPAVGVDPWWRAGTADVQLPLPASLVRFLKAAWPGRSYYGGPHLICQNCGASYWYQERNKRLSTKYHPVYTGCCRAGRVSLPVYPQWPSPLSDLMRFDGGSQSDRFMRLIREYNSMFAFTSLGVHVDRTVNVGNGPYVFKICGVVCHEIGSLLPPEGDRVPKFAQLYIYDTQNELDYRMGIFSQDDEIGDVAATDAPSASCAQSSSAVVGRRRRREDLSGDGFDASSTRPARRRRREEPDPAILQSLTTMLNGCNPLVQTFRMAKDRMFSPDAPEVAVRLYGHEGADHGNRYSLPVAPELAALIVDDLTVEACRLHTSFKAACQARGLVGDDNEWFLLFDEAVQWASSYQLRHLFMTVLLFCGVTDGQRLLDKYWRFMADDIAFQIARSLNDTIQAIPSEYLHIQLLHELSVMFGKNGYSLSSFGISTESITTGRSLGNRLILEELQYDRNELRNMASSFHGRLNGDQLSIYNQIMFAALNSAGGVFFVSGHGGIGKTFLWTSIIARLRADDHVVLAVASSGVASLLLPGGRTAHSRFRIPVEINERTMCTISRGSNLAKLIEKATLILWDEAPMTHRRCFEAVDRSMRDILSVNEPSRKLLPFGGKTIVLGGDFRQVLPVVEGASRAEVVNSSLMKSPLWQHVTVLKLQRNMRLSNPSLSDEQRADLEEFAQWVLDVGSGTPEMQALPLKALSPDGPKRKIVVRVSRIWEAKKRDTGNVYELAFVAVDYEGTVMEGNVPAVNMAQFKDVLKEGTIYTIQGFMVKPARDRYKTVDHQHRITITQYTKVQEVLPEPHGVPLVAHCLQPLSVLEKRARNTIVLSGKLCFKGTFLTRSYINIPIPEMLALQTKYGTPNNQSCFAI
ncbi:hypothetical protein ACQ4PT_044573 [Festuca glaucescens]